MRFKYRLLVISMLFAFNGAARAQDAAIKQECQPAKPPPHSRLPASTALREINVSCGANSITQNFAAPEPPASAPPSQRRSGDSSSTTTTAIISGAAAIFGALAGALASFLAASVKAKTDLELETKRLQANLIAAERLRWLQDIRQRLSTLYQQLDLQYNTLKRPTPVGQAVTLQQRLDDMSSEVMGQCNMITLMLNPRKTDQAALRDTLQSAMQFMLLVFQQAASGTSSFNDAQYAALKKAAFDAMTRIGVETWKQVKSLE